MSWEFMAGCNNPFHTFATQIKLFQQLFGLPRVGSVLDPFIRPPDDAVEDRCLLVIGGRWPQPAAYSELVVAPQHALEPVYLILRASCGEVITVH